MNYSAIKARVVKTIKNKGQPVTVITPGSPEGWTRKWNASEGRYYWENDLTFEIVYTNPAADDESNTGFVLELGYNLHEIDGTLVQVGDRRFLCAGIDKPDLTQKLKLGSDLLAIVSITPFQPGGTALYYEVQCRG